MRLLTPSNALTTHAFNSLPHAQEVRIIQAANENKRTSQAKLFVAIFRSNSNRQSKYHVLYSIECAFLRPKREKKFADRKGCRKIEITEAVRQHFGSEIMAQEVRICTSDVEVS